MQTYCLRIVQILTFCMATALCCPNVSFAAGGTPQKQTTKPAAKTTTGKDRIKKLQNEKTQVQQNVKKIDNKLTANQKNVQQKMQQIEQLNEDIRQRNAIIDSQNVQITSLAGQIEKMGDEILSMEMDYNVAKRKYVELVYHAYQKNSVYDRLLFLFSASTMQESYARFQYIREFAKMRRRQAADIKETKEELLAKRRDLERTKTKSETLLANREQEKRNVEKEKQQQKSLVESLKVEEKELRKQLKEQQLAADKLNRSIQKLIAEEAEKIAKSKAASKTTANKSGQTTQKQTAKPGTPAAKDAANAKTQQQTVSSDPESAAFEKQKGRMHWPVQRGRITGHYGLQKHPVLPNETVNNKGVYITSPAGIEALAVAHGKVTQIFSIPGSNNAVIVRHGSYLTVYANLTSIYVKVGQEVEQGDKLGRVYTDPDNNTSSQLFFQVWKEKNIQNPESWLRPLK